jgi:hypothetical protein
MTVILLPSPELQFADANGRPYAAGTIETYAPGGTTPKATWSDPAGGGGHLNTNPIVLDSAGRATIYGDGAYRLVLRDAAANLIWDAVTSSVVSAAMLPVVQAPTIADAVTALGIQALIDASVAAEATLRANGDATNAAAISAETTRAEAAEAALGTRIDNEIADRTAADAALQSQIDTINAALGVLPTGGTTRGGTVTADALSFYSIAFASPFPSVCFGIWIQPPAPINDKLTELIMVYTTLTPTGSTGQFVDAAGTPTVPATPMNYIAFGY